jgi:polysaccharide deacetylase 2 family uncharacterized protein YibQ
MSKKSSVMPGFLVLVLIAAAAGYFYYKNIYQPRQEMQENIIKKTAAQAEELLLNKILLDPLLYISRDKEQNEIMARLPARFSTARIKDIFNRFTAGKKNISGEFSEINNEKTSSITVSIKYGDETISKIRLVRNARPKIAVILDDWGYNKKGLPYLERIKYPFTAAVLPGLAYSNLSAETAHKNNKAVMLHLPMQPQKNLPREKRMILASMSAGEVKFVVDSLTSEIPYFTGINNHQGSLVTEDKRIMDIVLEEIKGRNLFFIDSLTSSKSIASTEAARLDVPAGKRDVFIDNQKELEYNEKQISELKQTAKKRGYAIGIGHDDIVTLQALEKNMPLLEAEGFEFVYAAELVF